MLKAKKRWHIQETDADEIEKIVRDNGVHPLIAQILAKRGLKEKEVISRYFGVDASLMYDPFLMADMKKAVERIHQAILKNEKILIYGDYDADGVTSTTLLLKVLSILDADFSYYIPNRFTEGYGLNHDAIEEAYRNGIKVIITVDTGISAVKEAELAKDLGITLIITDHHQPPAVLPDAFAVINPKRPGDGYPFKELAGVGVAFKLAHALLGRMPIELLDIVAIGTIADLVPLVDENRIIASLGLKQLEQTAHLGIKALLRENGLANKKVTAGHIGYIIAPRINASGRLDTAGHAVRLFITEDEAEAKEIAKLLDQINQERQSLVDQITDEALQIINTIGLDRDKVIIVAKENWNVGVIGIVASRILEKYYKPTIILSIDPETKIAKGSARSIEGYDIYQALTAAKDLLPHYGGHPAAAGLSINEINIPDLRSRLNKLADEWLSDEDFTPIEKVDAVCSLQDISLELIKQIEQMEPFGMGNPSPRILINQAEISDLTVLGNEKQHLKINVKDKNKYMEALFFKKSDLIKDIAPLSKVQLLGELTLNNWKGQVKPQIIVRDLQIPYLQIFDWRKSDLMKRIKDISFTDTALIYSNKLKGFTEQTGDYLTFPYDDWHKLKEYNLRSVVFVDLPPSVDVMIKTLKAIPELERIYYIFNSDDKLSFPMKVNRNLFKQVYLALKENSSLITKTNIEHYFNKFEIDSNVIEFVLNIFEELGFITVNEKRITVNPNPKKKDLIHSSLYRRYIEQEEVRQLFLYSNHYKLKTWFINQYYSK
ncbi:single-stranded-DNA-specific exonuclease RecJ [Vulcanibacillus modesticaldus]|uniref:Single-stranded-DNA-specific exonuclease RecJ n=2 Tax=Vulcanibacillus modesticaldus TaxID=337097 RepID=A0A1D2YTJ8_9BACI|nr:single-stranded-DNA-specific exonuclease RecJ [Vulcanibacillus modesticaldus]